MGADADTTEHWRNRSSPRFRFRRFVTAVSGSGIQSRYAHVIRICTVGRSSAAYAQAFMPLRGRTDCSRLRRMSRQPRRVILTMFLCIVGICCPPAPSVAQSRVRTAAPSRVAADVVKLTNVERTHHQRAALRANARLMRAAQLQAEQMAEASHMAHVLPDAPYPRMEDRIAAVSRVIRSTPGADSRNLVKDDAAFHEFQARVHALPPSPPSPAPPGRSP